MDWFFENWQLIASAVIGVFNVVLTLVVHKLSKNRITALEDKDGNGIPDQIEELIRINKQLLEKLQNEKKN